MVFKGVAACTARRELEDLLRGSEGVSIDEANEAREACRDKLGLLVRQSASRRSAKSSVLVPLLNS